MKTNAKISMKADLNLTSHFSPLTSNSRGITLVALIITIIIMLILVGVSISIAINGGLFDVTKRAVRETENAKNLEQQLANGRIKIGETWYDSIEDYVNDKPSANQGEGGGETPVTPPEEPDNPPPVVDTSIYENAPKDVNGILQANATYTSDGKTAVVPKGFKIVDGIEGTKSIADGLVIQDKDGNEFVWIPVEVTESDTETSIASFYRSEWKNNARSTSLMNNPNYQEPYSNGYEGETEEYNAMVKSVYKNKGFYIGRYEAGSVTERTWETSTTTEMVVKKHQYPYNYVMWGCGNNDITTEYSGDQGKSFGKGAVLLSKNMYQNKEVGVVSTLCYGIQWDAMLDFVKDKKNVTNSGSWGNFQLADGTSSPKNTGSSDSYSAKNIYDIAGNVMEWTMEFTDERDWCRNLRGSPYSTSSDRGDASCRTDDLPDYIGSSYGFRPTLYIK